MRPSCLRRLLSHWFGLAPHRIPIDRLFALRAQLESLEDRTTPALFTVTTIADSGLGSLRQAILDANAASGADQISFAIGTGPQTIAPLSALPTITEELTIDATTQPGWTSAPIIELRGDSAGVDVTGITITSANTTIRGFVINRFSGHGVLIIGSGATGNVIAGNYIGTNTSGNSPLPNADGVVVSAPNNTIGGATAADRNVISGNASYGVVTTGTGNTGNVIQNNYIGTDASGTAAVGNSIGASIQDDANTLRDNLISGNSGGTGHGVLVSGPAGGSVIAGNIIGLAVGGTTALPNDGDGISIQGSPGVLIGGVTATDRNVISGNAGVGIEIAFATATGNVISGNYIGTNVAGTAKLANGSGVQIRDGATGNTIGGTVSGARNIISGNAGAGIEITGSGTTGNRVQGNYIGTDVTGTLALSNGAGITIEAGANGNTIGGNVKGVQNVLTAGGLLTGGATGYLLAPNGDLLVSNANGDAPGGPILRVNTTTGAQSVFSANGLLVAPNEMAYGPDGKIYVADVGAARIVRIDPATGAQSLVSEGGGLLFPASLAFSSDGSLYVADLRASGQKGAIFRIDITTGAQTLLLEGDATLQPCVVRVASDGSLLVLFIQTYVSGPGRVERVNPATGARTILSAGGLLVNPAVLAIDRDGSLLVTNLIASVGGPPGNIVRINPATGAQSVAFSGGLFFDPGELIVTPNGDLYVSEYANDPPAYTPRVLWIPANAARNVISGNDGNGINISGTGTTGNVVAGNSIGTDKGGIAALGNTGAGIAVSSPNNVIGGALASTDPALGNTIAYNAGGGIQVTGTATGNTLRFNLAHDNTNFNVQVNTTPPATGYPTLNKAIVNPNGTRIIGFFIGTPNTTYTVDIYDPTGTRETRTFMGTFNVLVPASGVVDFDVTLPVSIPVGANVTGMATAPDGSTSEISFGTPALPPVDVELSAPSNVSEGVPITITSQIHSNNPDAVLALQWTAKKNGILYASSTNASFSFTPDDNGTYAVALVVTDLTNGATSNYSVPDIVVANAVPVVDLLDRDTNLPPVQTIQTGTTLRLGTRVTDPGVADTHTYQWSLDGVDVPGATNPTFDYTPTAIGIDTIQVRVTDDDGGVGGAVFVLHTGGTLPPAAILGAPTSSPEGGAIAVIGKLDGIYSAVALEYHWRVTKNGVEYYSLDSQTAKQQADFAFTPNDNGTYIITLSVRDPATGAVSLAPAVTVAVTNVAPVAVIRQPSPPFSVGAALNFHADTTDPGNNPTAAPGFPAHDDLLSYQWRVITLDGSSITGGVGSDFSFTPAAQGLFIVQLTIKDKDGSAFTQSSVLNVTAVGRTVTISKTNPASNTLYEGGAVTLHAAVTDFVPPGTTFRFAWAILKNGDTYATGTGADFTFTPNDNATYDVSVIATGSDTSSGSATASYSVLNAAPAPTVTANAPYVFVGNDLTAAEGTTLTFTGAANDPGTLDVPTLLWSVTGPGYASPITGTGRTFSLRLLDDGTYNLSLTATDKDGATSTINRTISSQNVAPNVTLSGGSTLNTNGQIAIAADYSDAGPLDNANPGAFAWYLNGVLDPGQIGPTFTFTPGSGTNLVRVDVADPGGAVATTTTLVVAGTTGNDSITAPTPPAAADRVLILGFAGDDTINAAGITIPVILDGGNDNDMLIGGSAGDLIFAGSGNNTIVAGTGNDTLVGGGNDSLDGGSGSDYYKVHFSTVTLTDSDGQDTIDLSDVPFGMTLDLNEQGTAQSVNSGNTSTLTLNGLFESVLGTTSADRFTAAPGTTLYGADGDDTLLGTGGSDLQLDGGIGSDMLQLSNTIRTTLYGADGDDAIQLINAPQSLILAGSGSDQINIGAGSLGTTLYGADGDDIIQTAGDDAVIMGGSGKDQITVSGGNNQLIVGGDADFLIQNGIALSTTLYGASGDDSLTLLGGDSNTVLAGDGNDSLVAAGGMRSTLYGADGNDLLQNVAGNQNLLVGDLGNDTIVGAGGDLGTLLGGFGNDLLIATQTATRTTLYGADGNDLLISATGNGLQTLSGGTGNDTLVGNLTSPITLPGGITLDPTTANDLLLIGGDGNDLMLSGIGDRSTLYGAGDDDTIITTGGDDQVLVGGTGNDTLLQASTARSTIYGAEGDDTLIGGLSDGETLPGVVGGNNLVLMPAIPDRPTLYGGDGNDVLIDTNGDNAVLVGDGGDDQLMSLTNLNRGTLYGADGDDLLVVPAAGTPVPVQLDGQSVTLLASGAGLGGTLYGADGNDTLIGSSGTAPVLLGGNDQDLLIASGSTRPSIYGGDGDDTLISSSGSDALLVGETGKDALVVSGGLSTTLYGADGDDTLIGTGGTTPVLLGGSGGDLIAVGAGVSPTLYGSDGDDTLIAASSDGGALLVGADGNDRLIANPTTPTTLLPGTPFEVTLPPATGGRTTLYGGDGDDTLISSAGDNMLLLGADGNNAIVIRGGTDNVAIGGANSDTLIDLSLLGRSTLYGADGDDTLAAGNAPDDTLVGEAGNDTLIAITAPRSTLFGSLGDDRILLGGSISLLSGIDQVTLVGPGGDGSLGYGAEGDDQLSATGGSGQVLVGGDGNDTLTATNTLLSTLYGLTGDDTLLATDGADAILLGGIDNDTLTVASGTRMNLYGEAGNDTLNATGGSQLKLFGGADNDHLDSSVLKPGGSPEPGVVLIGGSGDDTTDSTGTAATQLWGGTGSDLLIASGLADDLMLGEEGDDLYQVSLPNSLVTVTLDEVRKYSDTIAATDEPQLGTDVLDFAAYSSIFIDLANVNTKTATLEHLQHVAANLDMQLFGTFEHVIGTPGNDTILGNAADNILIGNGGDDTLDGREGNDTLAGGEGNNTLIGGNGNDTFFLSATQTGADLIDDPSTDDQDVLDLSAQPAGVTVDLGLSTAQALGARTFTIVGGVGVLGATGTASSDILIGTDGNNVLRGREGDDSLVGGPGNDTLEGGAGDDTVDGGIGDDWYIEVPGSTDYRIEPFGSAGGIDTLDFSSARSGISLDLGQNNGQLQTVDQYGDRMALTGDFEHLIGSGFSDVIVGNGEANKLIGGGGRDSIDGAGGDDLLNGGFQQVVFLDFDSATQPFEWQYTAQQRADILARLQAIYSPFGVVVTLDMAQAKTASADDGGFTTIRFNDGPAGGSSDQIDWRNLNAVGTAHINAAALLGGLDTSISPPLTGDNVVALSYTIAAHELGHLMGLRHGDAFGAIGAGDTSETIRHIMASPDSLGISVYDSLQYPYIGEREAIKLAFARNGVAITEPVAPHGTLATAAPLGALPGLTVPNTLQLGDDNYGVAGAPNTFTVDAQDVAGSLSTAGETDIYAFTATQGQLFTFELMSTTLKRFAGSNFDPVLRLYDPNGALLAVNDNDFESLDATLRDVTLPTDGTYYLEVAAADGQQTGHYELFGYTFVIGADTGRGDTLVGSAGQDTLIGGDSPDVFVITADATANQVHTSSATSILDVTRNPNYAVPDQVTGTPIIKSDPNTAPVFEGSTVAPIVTEGNSLAFQVHASDPNDQVTYSLVGTVPPGASIDPATGAFLWVPGDNNAITFIVRATDTDGLFAEQSIPVVVLNANPTTTGLAGPTSLVEGSTGTFTLINPSDSSPADAAALRYSYALTAVGFAADYASASGTNSFTYGLNDEGNFTVYARGYDKDGGISVTQTLAVTVSGAAPTAAITSAPSSGLEGGPLNFTGLGTDVGPADITAGLTYIWSVTDNNGQAVEGGLGTTFGFTPIANGLYTITLKVMDKDRLFSTASVDVPVMNVAPTIARPLVVAPTVLVEASAITISTTFADPGSVAAGGVETYTYRWQVVSTSNGQVVGEESGTVNGDESLSFTFTPADNGGYTVLLLVTEQTADAASDAVQLVLRDSNRT